MRRHFRLRAAALVAKRLLGAAVLGVATILLIKREPDQHWSDPPIITMVEDHDQAVRSGAPLVRSVRLRHLRGRGPEQRSRDDAKPSRRRSYESWRSGSSAGRRSQR
jgi:hypothetical protein